MNHLLKLTIVILCLPFFGHGQEICKKVDPFTDEVTFWHPTNMVVYQDAAKTKGLGINLLMAEKKGQLVPNYLMLSVAGISSCVDQYSELHVIFQGGDKIKLTSFTKFNCDGWCAFFMTKKQMQLFETKEITGVKFVEAKSFESITSLELDNGDFIMQVFANMAAYNQTGQIAECEK